MEIHPLIDPFAIHFDTFTGGVYTINSNSITLTNGTLTAASLKVTGLTATRVLFAGAGGVVSDDAGMTYSAGLDLLRVGSLETDDIADIAGLSTIDLAGGIIIASSTVLKLAGVNADGGIMMDFLGGAAITATFKSGSWTDSSGAISFGNENLSTTGTFQATGNITSLARLTGDSFLHTGSTQDYLFTDRVSVLAIQSQTSATPFGIELFSKDGDATDIVSLAIYGKGTPASISPAERLTSGWDSSNSVFFINTQKLGAGTIRDLAITTEAWTRQVYLDSAAGLVGFGTLPSGAQVHILAPNSDVAGATALSGIIATAGNSKNRLNNDTGKGGGYSFTTGSSGNATNDNSGEAGDFDIVLAAAGTAPLGTQGRDGQFTAGDGTNQTVIERDGTLTFEGNATVFNDLVLPLDSAKVPASNAPNWESFVGNLNAFAYEVGDYQEFTTELIHGYKEGSTFQFHIHGALNATTAQEEKVQFEIEYSIADANLSTGFGDVFPDGSGSLLTAELVVPNATNDLTNIFITVGVDSSGSFGIDATIKGRIRRIAKSVGGNELTGDIFITQVGVHYEIDTVGSRTTLTK